MTVAGMTGKTREAPLLRKLTASDAELFVELRAEMLVDMPESFLGAPGDDSGLQVDVVRGRFSHPTNATFGAFVEGSGLVAVVGFFRLPQAKVHHKGMIVSVYTTPSERRKGLSRELVKMAIDHARTVDGVDVLQLSVSTVASAAQRLYASMGFVEWGCEPRALRAGSAEFGEVHMWMSLDGT